MTALARMALDHCQAADARLYGPIKVADDIEAVISLVMPLDQVPEALSRAVPGDYFVVAVVQLDHTGAAPKPLVRKSRGHRLSAYAHRICEDREFQAWAIDRMKPPGVGYVFSVADDERRVMAQTARQLILMACQISDRGKLIGNPDACDRFERLLTEFHAAHGRTFHVEIQPEQP